MRVLVACEFSGVVREAFRRRGHTAYSCDLLPAADGSNWHWQCDVLELLRQAGPPPRGFDLMIAHPPCIYLSVSGLHWNRKDPERARKTDNAMLFVQQLLNAPVPRIALENPVGCISTRLRRPDQILQPYMFGEDASKKTCLWLKGLLPLLPTRYVEPRIVDGRPRWGNQTDSGQNRLGPSPDRWKLRSITYTGIAEAMADQWSMKNE